MFHTKIITIPILPLGMINAFLIAGSDGAILIDTGLPGTEKAISKALRKNGLVFEDIKLIVITHAHIDHAGNAGVIQKLTGNAPMVGHQEDLKYFLQQEPMTFCSTGWFGNIFRKTGLIERPYSPFSPEIILSGNDTLSLVPYGVPGLICHTPGHTSGSISIELDNNEAIVGDLISSGILLGGIIRKNHAKRPPFEDNPHKVGEELTGLVNRGIKKFYMSHGGPLIAPEVRRHAEYLQTLQISEPS